MNCSLLIISMLHHFNLEGDNTPHVYKWTGLESVIEAPRAFLIGAENLYKYINKQKG